MYTKAHVCCMEGGSKYFWVAHHFYLDLKHGAALNIQSVSVPRCNELDRVSSPTSGADFIW
jgi:hypothetical protein